MSPALAPFLTCKMLKLLSDHRCPVPLQYGILLYQNYKIPQQRKTLLSHFSAPVVSCYNADSSDLLSESWLSSAH